MTTDKKFTGQRLDSTGLYYYGARYYDPAIGRFISADTVVQNPANPQTLNRYAYALNNPLKYIDPSGQEVRINGTNVEMFYDWAAYGQGWMPTPNIISLLSSPEFQAYNQLHYDYPTYSEYLERSDEIFNVISNNVPTQNQLQQVANGDTLLQVKATRSNIDVSRYTPSGFWNFMTGGWTREAKRPPVNSWGEIKQKFADADWGGLGRAVVGSFEIAAGSTGTIFFGSLALV